MSDDTHCRFQIKTTVNGRTDVNGRMSSAAIDGAFVTLCESYNIPVMDFRCMANWRKGHHFHADIETNGDIIAFEIECVADAPERETVSS